MSERTSRERVRSDAARNRRAILDATAALLAKFGHENVTTDQIAAAAGVGKGTVFHRFGSRAQLIHALVLERAHALRDAVTDGPPPLGPGAPAAERLVAYFDAMTGNIVENIELVMAYEDAESHRQAEPLHAFWHRHVTALLSEARPDVDAEAVAYVLLTALAGQFPLRLIRAGQADRYAAGVRVIVESVVHGRGL